MELTPWDTLTTNNKNIYENKEKLKLTDVNVTRVNLPENFIICVIFIESQTYIDYASVLDARFTIYFLYIYCDLYCVKNKFIVA